MDDRGQTFTLEVLIGVIILLAAVAFALQAVSISSNTASIADSELRGQQVGLAEGLIEHNAENSNLTAALLYWNETDGRFIDSDVDEGFYVSPSPNTTFGENVSLGESLEAVLDDPQIRYNINLVYYEDSDGNERDSQLLVESGTPSNDAVRIVDTVTLTDDMRLVDRNETVRDPTLGELEPGEFYAPNVDEDRELYNVIRVEVVLWQV